MLHDEINLILEKYKTVINESETGKYYKMKKEDAKKEPKLTSAQEEKLLTQTAIKKQKTKNVTDEDAIDVKKSDLNKDGKLSKYETARGKAIDKARGGDGKLPKGAKTDEDAETPMEKSPDILSKPKRKLDSFEKYKLGQAKRFLKNVKTFNKILSHTAGMTEKEAKKYVKKFN
jgi:hypothetical protein